ncbi:hypothetical protein SH668x_000299 [Planctomicrobium sp. SH668]|uniref:hypothetical protein n=1 Tax=Planctomicrobium sp. SH668 TaxID=3448126 RepID=UPI003F5C0573
MTQKHRLQLQPFAGFDGRSVASGFLAGAFLICSFTPLRAELGTNHEVDSAIVLVAVICSLFAMKISSKLTDLFGKYRSVLLASAGLWTLAIPEFLPQALKLLSRLSIVDLNSIFVSYLTTFAFTAACLAPIFVLLRLVYRFSEDHGVSSKWQWLTGLGLSFCFLPAVVLPVSGTAILAWTCIAICGILAFVELTSPRRSVRIPEGMVAVATVQQHPRWSSAITALVTGAAISLTVFVAAQLIPRNLTGDMALLGGLVLGVSMAVARRSMPRTAKIVVSSSIVCLWLAAWLGAVTAGFPYGKLLCLQINAWASNVGLQFLLRIVLLMALFIPAGVLVRRLVANQDDSIGKHWLIALSIAVGFIAAPFFPFSVRASAISLMLISLALAAYYWYLEEFRLPTRLIHRIGTTGLSILALSGLIFSGNLDPRQSERVLLSSVSMGSFRAGVPVEQLAWLDDSRQVADFTSDSDYISLTRTRAAQIVMRRNGLVMGTYSSNPLVSPHLAGDLLPALIPLTLHANPENVLVIGMHPPTLMTCHAWPLRSVHTLDSSRAAHEMIHWITKNPEMGLNLDQGADFQFSCVEPAVGLRAKHGQLYDLITCPMTHPASTSTDQLTTAFYKQVKSNLHPNGIFTQRVPYFDLGPEVIREITSNLQSTFGEVRAIESVPGELIFVCAAEHLPAIDVPFVDRLKAPQVRSLLSDAGWDWSIILGRGALDHDSLKQLSAVRPRSVFHNSTGLAYRLPLEIGRWDAKLDATRIELAKFGSTLRAELGEGETSKEVTERLEDMNLTFEIQRDHPNDPWAYRGALKDRLQKRPRTAIVQVNHELKRKMDPEDQRRKDYLVALGPAAKSETPSNEMIEQVLQFQYPFDPLVTPFIYFEAANLFSRNPDSTTEQRLACLLHTIYFSAGYDESVRNVSDALELTVREDLTLASSETRWDLTNSLIQSMAQRWQLRMATGKVSKYESADVQKSLTAIDLGMKYLEDHYAEAGLTDFEWKQRKSVIEKALIKKLRQHRSELALLAPSEPNVKASK